MFRIERATALLIALLGTSAAAQNRPSTVLDTVITVGTRATDRTATKSAVPVDVITREAIEASGLVETWQVLQRLIPALNVPHIPRGDDGTRPVTLRGLSPAQILLLVNGKRVHTPALILAGPVLSGMPPNDIGWIPVSAIERIEVLRDGAAAQYGSDAIAGVINVIVKTREEGQATLVAGESLTSEGGRSFRDGKLLDFNGAYSLRFGSLDLLLSGEVRDRGSTNRAYPDMRRQYFTGDPGNLNPPVVRNQEGDAEHRDAQLFLNSSLPLRNGIQLYSFGGASTRHSRFASSFRRALDSRNTVRAIHPDGFLPLNSRETVDYSFAAGSRQSHHKWHWDANAILGANTVRHGVENSNNASLGAASPVDFYIGTLSSRQLTSTLDLSRAFALRKNVSVNFATGGEYRHERYQIEAGDSVSYVDGRQPILDGDSAGLPATIGAQGMLGFRPADEIVAARHNVAGYADLETKLGRQFLLDVAGRMERYSDYGSTSDGKIATRIELLRGVALRAAMGSGFRAPSLSQSYFATTRTILVSSGGKTNPYVIRTLPVHTEVAKLLGAKRLEPEESRNISAGVVFDFYRLPVVTADFYSVKIDDRIIRSSEFRDPSVRRFLEQHGIQGVAGGQYFANAIDTKTRGVDVVMNYTRIVRRDGVLKLVGGLNHTRTRVTHVAQVPAELRNFQEVLFGRTQRGAIEQGQPRMTLALTADYSNNRFRLNVHNQRFGAASLLDADSAKNDQRVAPKWITDVAVSYRLQEQISLSATAENLFDVYPTEWIDFKEGVNATGMSIAGNFRYPGGISPFGMNGRTIYLKASYRRK